MLVCVLLLIATSAWAESSQNYKNIVKPLAKKCAVQLYASEDEVNAMVNLDPELFARNINANCLAACVFHEMGVMRDASWLAVPYDKRIQMYRDVFKDDPVRLAAAEYIVGTCCQVADEKYPGDECNSAYSAIECFWQRTY